MSEVVKNANKQDYLVYWHFLIIDLDKNS